MFFSMIGFSQSEITVILKDADTDLPIGDAIITILRTNEGLISNAEGVFKLNLTRPSLLEISHTSYKKLQVKSNTLIEDGTNIITLEKETEILQEVILTERHPQEILKDLVKNSLKKLTVPANLRVFTREFFKTDDKYSFYNDGLVNFQILDEKRNIKTDILVEQNRTIGLIDEFDKDLLGYNLNNLMENYYQFKYLDKILDSRAKKKYDFQLLTYPQNQNYLLIKVKPYTTIDGFMSEYSILYDSKKKIILEVTSFLPEDRAQNNSTFLDFKNRKIYKSVFKNTYRLETRDYYLANSKEEIGFTTEKNKIETKFEVSNYLITTEFRTNIFKYDDAEIFKDKTLLNKKDSVLTEYWEIDTGVLLTQTEKDIINNLKN
ncbi:hypothetical protein ACFO3U_11875 [Flavobacterium ponti]|jgi:hypothetical protein|uniref:Carboxypeptidase-like regulatory domain-containing protein n=2 Tax=Flavobacterium ponti TaxID=665133 RepID=A0ABV9P658_9FLAO